MSFADALIGAGYLGLICCYCPQNWRVWRTRRIDGISPWFLAILVCSLAVIQAGVMAQEQWWIAAGNGAALLQAIALEIGYQRAIARRAEMRRRFVEVLKKPVPEEWPPNPANFLPPCRAQSFEEASK